MFPKRKPRRRPLGYFDAQSKMMGLRGIYQTSLFGAERAGSMAQPHHRDLDDSVLPEPDEELTDSELSDNERRAAIARERMRREGLI